MLAPNQESDFLGLRLQQDRGGRYFLDESNTGFTFSVQENAGRHLGDVLKAFVVPPTPEVQLTTRLAADFVEQLDIVGYLAGKSPLVGLRLTQVQEGSVLAISLCHVLAGAINGWFTIIVLWNPSLLSTSCRSAWTAWTLLDCGWQPKHTLVAVSQYLMQSPARRCRGCWAGCL